MLLGPDSLKFNSPPASRLCVLLISPLLLSACASTGSDTPPPAAAAVAGAAVAAKPAPPAEQAPDGVLAGPLGGKLSEADRKSAFAAQIAALSSGQRKTWRGTSGAFGYVEPGGAGAFNGACRAYTHTVYLAGRPQPGQGGNVVIAAHSEFARRRPGPASA